VRGGGHDVAIESLQVGDVVLSPRVDEVHGVRTPVERRVEAIHFARSRDVCRVHVGGRVITTTRSHPFWEAERRRWIPAGELEVGMTLVTADSLPVSVERVEYAEIEIEVFNLTVEGPEHTYFAEDIAVHNKTFPSGSLPPSMIPVEESSDLLGVRNNTRAEIRIGLVSVPSPQFVVVEDALLARALEVDFPAARHFGAIVEQRRIPVGALELIAGPHNRMNLELDDGLPAPGNVVVFEVERRRYLAAGRGAIILRQSSEDGGRIEALAEVGGPRADRLRLVELPTTTAATTCTTSKEDPAVVVSNDIVEMAAKSNAEVVVVSSTGASHQTLGCRIIRLQDQAAGSNNADADADVCVPNEDAGRGLKSWPFVDGDRLRVLPPMLLADAASRTTNFVAQPQESASWQVKGVRFERISDGVVLELGQLSDHKNGGLIFFNQSSTFEREDTSCVLINNPSCGTSTYRTRVLEPTTRAELAPLSAPIDVIRGYAAVVRATKSPLTFDCEKTRLTLDVIAWSQL